MSLCVVGSKNELRDRNRTSVSLSAELSKMYRVTNRPPFDDG